MECPECGYTYAGRYAPDRKRHRVFHDKKLNGLPAPFVDDKHIIWEGEQPTLEMLTEDDIPTPCIIALTPRSPLKLRKLANTETQYTGGVYHYSEKPDPERDRHVFLYELYARFAGLVVFDRRSLITPFTWEEYDQKTARGWAETTPFWSVSFLWTLRKYRRTGIATRLISFAADHLGTSLDQVGVSQPLTEDGERLARALFPDKVKFGS